MNITQEQLNSAVQEALKGALVGLPAMQTQGNNITLKEFGARFMKDKKSETSNTTYAKAIVFIATTSYLPLERCSFPPSCAKTFKTL